MDSKRVNELVCWLDETEKDITAASFDEIDASPEHDNDNYQSDYSDKDNKESEVQRECSPTLLVVQGPIGESSVMAIGVFPHHQSIAVDAMNDQINVEFAKTTVVQSDNQNLFDAEVKDIDFKAPVPQDIENDLPVEDNNPTDEVQTFDIINESCITKDTVNHGHGMVRHGARGIRRHNLSKSHGGSHSHLARPEPSLLPQPIPPQNCYIGRKSDIFWNMYSTSATRKRKHQNIITKLPVVKGTAKNCKTVQECWQFFFSLNLL